MPALTLTYTAIPIYVTNVMLQGCVKKGYTLSADARIRNATLTLGVGPICYAGKTTEGVEDPASGSKVPNDAMFFFVDEDGDTAKYAVLEDVDPTDLQDTIAAFLTNMGGDIATMKARMPA